MKKRMRFIMKGKQSASQTPIQPPQTDTQLSSFYRNIDLPLKNFETCLLDKNLSSLIISGFPKEVDLMFAWETIIQEYTEALGSSEFILYRNMFKQVEILKLDMAMLTMLVTGLRKNYSLKLCGELNAMLRTRFPFNIKDVKSYLSDLKKCEGRMGGLKINLDLKVLEFEAIKKNHEEKNAGKPIDNNYFTSMLVILSRVNGFRLTKDISVREYCEYYRQCAQENEKSKKKEIPRY